MAIKLGIIGAGGISGAHVGAAGASGGEIVIGAVADANPEAAQRLATQTGARAFTSADALVGSAGELGLAGVVVCTPPSARVEIVRAAVRAGLAVLSEKPLANNVGDASAIASIVHERPGSKVAVAYCHRFAPAVLEMKRQLQAGRLGVLTRFENVFACDLPGHESRWFSDPRVAGGGAFIDMGSHSLDLLHFVVGPSRVRGAVFDRRWPGRAETGATVLLTARDASGRDVASLIASGWAESSRFTVSLVGTEGTLFYDYERPTELVFRDLLGKAEVSPIEPHDVRFARQLAAFAAWAGGGATPGGLASVGDGVAAAQGVEDAARAAGQG